MSKDVETDPELDDMRRLSGPDWPLWSVLLLLLLAWIFAIWLIAGASRSA